MATPEWGAKRICQSCAIKFYDFDRSPIVCPQCSAKFDPESLLKSRRTRPPASAKPPLEKVVAKPANGELKEAVPGQDDTVDLGQDATVDLGQDDKDLANLADDDDKDAVIEDVSGSPPAWPGSSLPHAAATSPTAKTTAHSLLLKSRITSSLVETYC